MGLKKRPIIVLKQDQKGEGKLLSERWTCRAVRCCLLVVNQHNSGWGWLRTLGVSWGQHSTKPSHGFWLDTNMHS